MRRKSYALFAFYRRGDVHRPVPLKRHDMELHTVNLDGTALRHRNRQIL